MRDFQGKVAVVTGAGSGIGRAMAERFAWEGMAVVLADVEKAALTQAEAELQATGARVLAVQTDVSDGAAVESLAQQSLDRFGAVHVVCKNAGVGAPGRVWEFSVADWTWVLGVNLWGVIHGVRVFVPIMLRQQTEGHVVNTASGLGLTTELTPAGGPYYASKHAVVALSEVLAQELQQAGAQVRVSVICPGMVRTEILTAERNRPSTLANPDATKADFPDWFRAQIEAGTPPAAVAEQVFAAVRDERFYILHPALKERVRARMEGILDERNPTAGAFQPATHVQSSAHNT